MCPCPNKLAAVLASVLAFGAGAAVQAGEKIELRGSTSLELPKPERKIEEERRFKFDNGASELSGGFAAPQNINNTGPLDRKLREMLDRKKNWIFVNPYDKPTDDRTSEMLGEDQGTGSLLEHRLLKEDDKSAMQKFLEEKDTRRGSSDEASEDMRDREESDFGPNRGEKLDDERDGSGREEKNAIQFLTKRDAQNFKAPGFDASAFEKRMERTPLDGTLFSQRAAQRPELNADELKRQQETREAEFEKFIQPRGLPASVGGLAGRLDPLNTASDSTRQEANPASARRTDQFLSQPNRVDFSGGGRGGMSASLPGSSFDFDAGQRAGQSGGFMPTTAPGPAAATPSRGPAPFVFELPRRKF